MFIKQITGTIGSMNFSGFDRDNWPCRTGPRHVQDAVGLLNIQTKTELQKAESQLGCRYSVLLELPYSSNAHSQSHAQPLPRLC